MVIRFGHFAFIFVLLTTLISCSSDAVLDDDENVAEQEQVQIYFTINMGSPSTRATWGDNTDEDENNNYASEEATYNENTIFPEKFQVLVFDTDGNYLDELDDLTYFRHSDTENNVYDVVATLSIDKSYVVDGKLKCKLVVLANYDNAVDVSKISTLSDLGSITYSYSNHMTADIVAGTKGIPMFGIKTTDEMKMTAGFRTDAGTIYMLRAMAKIVVNLNLDTNGNGVIDTGEEYAITSVSLTNCNQTGYIVPKGYAGVSETTDLTMVDLSSLNWDKDNTFNPYNTSSTTTLSLQKESDTEYCVYVPECVISSENRPTFSIRFAFMIDTYPSYTFDFDKYENGVAKKVESYNIERNHVYTFTITKGKGSFSIDTDDWTNTFDNEYTF